MLIAQVRWIVVKPKSLVAFHGFDRALRRRDIKRDFRRMHFQRKVHVDLIECVQDWRPTVGEVFETFVPIGLVRRREGINAVPDARAGEAVDDCGERALFRSGIEKQPRRLGGVDHLGRSAFANAFGLAVAPDIGRENQLMPFVDQIANGLTDKVIGNRIRLQAILCKNIPTRFDVTLVGERLVHIEVIAPAGELDPVITKFPGFFAKRFERQIGPLAAE